jgi:hypothetical protein
MIWRVLTCSPFVGAPNVGSPGLLSIPKPPSSSGRHRIAETVAIAGRWFLVSGITGLLLWPVGVCPFSHRWRVQ